MFSQKEALVTFGSQQLLQTRLHQGTKVVSEVQVPETPG